MKIYFFAILFIVGWWAIAFHEELLFPVSENFHVTANSNQKTHIPLPASLLKLDRNELLLALTGDFKLMGQLIAKWDVDAQILQSYHYQTVKTLSREDFLRSQLIYRQLSETPTQPTSYSKKQPTHSSIVDSRGKIVPLNKTRSRFLPQTFVSASFLLALAPPNEIVALPRQLREYTDIFPVALTSQIPLDIDRYNSERLFLEQPDLAFVATYSHPSTIHALSNQAIELYTMKDLNSLQDIKEELMALGSIINRPYEAEMLKIFMDAAFIALDNRIELLVSHLKNINDHLPRILFLNHYQNFSSPAPHTVTAQLMDRLTGLNTALKIEIENAQNDKWMIPLSKESLSQIDPDYLIIATENAQILRQEMLQDPALQTLSAVRHQHLHFVDAKVQQLPSQYVVLAYYDIIQGLINLP